MKDYIKLQNLKSEQLLITSLENANKRSEIILAKIISFDNIFALFRLISIISFLAIIVSIFQYQSVNIIFLLIVLFLFYCIFTSWVHKKIQTKLSKWKAITASYKLSVFRINRNFDLISNHKSPWHDEVIQVPKGHIYSSDLDVHTELFSLFDTCSTREGSIKLFKLFMESGISPDNTQEINRRSHLSKQLSFNSQLLRNFEALRLEENYLQKFFKYKDVKVVNIENKNYFYIRNFYSIINILAWFFIIFPALLKLIKTQNTEEILSPIFLYSLFLMIGIFLFKNTVKNAQYLSMSSKIIEEVVNIINNKKIENVSSYFTFFEKKSIKNLKYLNFLINLISLRGNPIFWITVHIFFPFDAIICFLLQNKLKKLQSFISIWKEELYEFDLLASFARFQIENPSSRFLNDHDRSLADPNFVEFTKLGHPLIAAHKRIYNSIKLQKNSPVILLTGSNMAGKSTFLRTIGTNILLSNMGAPVFADKFILSPSKLLCAIRIDDSLSDGTSYFYAEVKRLKYILDSLNDNKLLPSIFLIDEIFRGTNNKERYIGGLNIIHALFEKNSFGFISTHDLALSDISNNDNRLINMHFREHIEENKLMFDYKLKDGPCPTTNALFIMRQEGLPIPQIDN